MFNLLCHLVKEIAQHTQVSQKNWKSKRTKQLKKV
jgi:hypothetical protein